MPLRTFIAAIVIWIVGAACAPSVQVSPLPAPVVTAVFDPLNGKIPLPNDLALRPPPPGTPLPSPAQQELLGVFAAQGGFPNDQEVPVTLGFQRTTINADGTVSVAAPDLDLTTFTPDKLVVLLQTPSGVGTVALDPIQTTDYANGTLTLHHLGRQPWAPGQYLVALRGGPNGVKTKTSEPVSASQTFYLVVQGQDLNTEQNLAILRAQAGSTAGALALANQLDALIDSYRNNGVFAAVDQVFPHQETAVLTTFAIAPLHTQVQLDPGRGLVPLPIDLLRDPRPASSTCAACGKLTPLAACTLAGGKFNAATGACTDSKGNPVAAVAGFAALDGFSTTGMILAPTSDLLQASTITTSTVQLYDLTNPALPQLVTASTYVTEPVEVTQQGLTPVIALAPAGATSGDPTSVFRTRPLKDNTMYAVVIGDGVMDKTGKPLARGTVASILQLKNPVVDSAGHSQLAGVDDPTAGALEVMRQSLVPVLAATPVNGINTGHAAMAYTFKTESILGVATQLGALPYAQPAATALPGTVIAETPTVAFAKYGVSGDVSPTVGPVPSTHINEILETTITTFNLLDPLTGAFSASGTAQVETINVLIATPKTAPACTGALTPFGKCSPLVVFRHGLAGSRSQMLTVADGFAAQGFTVAAIDAAKHGDRSFCTSGQATFNLPGVGAVPQCGPPATPGGACTTALPAGAQGDANPPGSCGTNGFFYRPVSGACQTSPSGCNWTGTEGIPVVSSNYLVTSNFFRSRDTLRQDIIDESQLVRAIAFVPSGTPPTGHNVFDHMVLQGLIINPATIYYVGQSLGSIQGAVDVATNPRISKAVLNVGGGTVVDIFTNSPAFVATTNQLLATLGIQPGANSGYLQFLVVAKTILDPADPVNFAGHLTANTLPNLLADQTGKTAQSAKSILAQAAFCDQVVPNPFNYILDSNIGVGPLPPTGAAGTFELFFTGTGPPTPTQLQACPAPPANGGSTPGAVSHGFITDWADTSATSQAQTDAAAFLSAGTNPPSIRVVP